MTEQVWCRVESVQNCVSVQTHPSDSAGQHRKRVFQAGGLRQSTLVEGCESLGGHKKVFAISLGVSDEEPDLWPRPLSHYHWASEAILLLAPLIDLLEFILYRSSFCDS